MTIHNIGNLDLRQSQLGNKMLVSSLEEMVIAVREDQSIMHFVSPFGTHGVTYGEDDDGKFASIGMNLNADVYAEIEDGTYGELQAFRIYLDT